MDHRARLARLRESLRKPLLVTNLTNVRYLTGFSGSNAFLLVQDSGVTFITDGRYGEIAASLLQPIDNAELVVYNGPLMPALAARLQGLTELGLESQHVKWHLVLGLRRELGAELEPTVNQVEALRLRKETAEVEALRRAAQAGDAAFGRLESLAAGAGTEGDLGWRLIEAMRDAGGEQAAWMPIVAAGPNAARPHHRAGDGKLEPGLLLLDYGCVVDGYHSDMTRTVWRDGGVVDPQMQRVYDAVAEAHAAGVGAVKPGATGREVDEVCRSVLRSYGFEMHFLHSTGHGVGLDIHEGPRLAKTSEDVLEPGHVVTVEPGVYLQGRGGVRIEDMVLVTEDGHEVLTTSPRGLVAP